MPKTPRLPSRRSRPPVSTGLPDLRGNTAQELAAVIGAIARGGAPPSVSSRSGNSEISQATTLLTQVLRILTLVYSTHLANTAATTANTAATIQNSSAVGVGGEGNGESSGLFGGLLSSFRGVTSILSLGLSLFGLFNRPKQPNLNLTPFAGGSPLSLEVANTDNILAGLPRVDFSADGTPRAVPVQPATGAASQAPVQVTMNISAMDSRSFMDNAPAIAQAVRSAMLNMHPINQLVRETL